MKTTNKGSSKTPPGKQSADQVSELTTNRLSVYLRCLNVLETGRTVFRCPTIEHSVENLGIVDAVSVHVYSPPLVKTYDSALEISSL